VAPPKGEAGAVLRAGMSGSHWTDFMLFELLYEVLFRFPLRYLFAIGYHAFILSLGWPAPPIFSRHYQAGLLAGQTSPYVTTRSRVTPCALGYHPVCCGSVRFGPALGLHFPLGFRRVGFGLGLILVRSQLLKESQLISFPPLTYMLKFSG
jgi:hypothetical protein